MNKELIDFCLNPEDPNVSWRLARWYEDQGQYAPAHTYYQRCSERIQDDIGAYRALIRSSFCYKNQGSRDASAKAALENCIALLPKRPEAYFFLSQLYEHRKDWQNSYLYAHIGEQWCTNDLVDIDIPEYPGKFGHIFQKAVVGWYWGKNYECRDLFQLLVNEYWDDMNDEYKSLVENNIIKLGCGPAEVAHARYKEEDYPLLRYKFPGSKNLKNNCSQIYQDMFVLSILDGKKNGTYLEIGGGDPFHGNNTAVLEKQYGWVGVSLELDKSLFDLYRNNRFNSIFNMDALDPNLNYDDFIQEHLNTDVVDLLQLDIEPARKTYELLDKIPWDKYKFRIILYEHDYFADITGSFRKKSRERLSELGYVLVANDMSADGKSSFEDWWVYPDLIDPELLKKMTSIQPEVQKARDYILPGDQPSKKYETLEEPKVKFYEYNKTPEKTLWIVDKFYEDPDAIRNFALNEPFFEGGFGRGFIGRRSEKQYLFPGLKEKFEDIMGMKITKWNDHEQNGRFQSCWSGEALVYHCDSQRWAGMLYLSPGAPYQCGTTLYAHKQTRARTYHEPGWDAAWDPEKYPEDCHLDGTHFEPVDVVGNVYNRLMIFDASAIHSASEYFGTTLETGRLWQMFFFDT